MGIVNKISDISQWQEQGSALVDFNQAKNELELAVIRVQAGSSNPDVKYSEFVGKCKQYKIPFGTYAYGRFISIPDAIQEAKDCYARMDKSTQFVVVDVETQSCHNPADLIPATQAYIDYLHSQGVKKVGLYSGEGFYKDYKLSGVKADFIWLACYGVDDGSPHTKPSVPCDIWQYTSAGNVAGFLGHVDLDMLVGSKPLYYFTGAEVEAVATSVPSQPMFPPVFCMKDTVYAKVQSVGGNDIRKAPTHNSEYVRNANDNEVFDAYDFVGGFFNIGQDNWIDSNGGKNAHIIQSFHSSPVDPFQKPFDPNRNVAFAEIQSVGGNDIRKAPTHNSDYVRNTKDGEVFGAYDFINGFFNIGGDNWIDGNGGRNAYIINNIFPEPQPYKQPAPAPKPVAPVPAQQPAPVVIPVVAPKPVVVESAPVVKPVEVIQPSANVVIQPAPSVAFVPTGNVVAISSANIGAHKIEQISPSLTIDPSGNMVIKSSIIPSSVVSGNVIPSTDTIIKDVAEKVQADPIVQEAEKSIFQRIIAYILSIFKGGK